MTEGYRSGAVTLVGRPNVGKSTLLNRLVGSKVSITSRRPQTTWHRILGVMTTPRSQIAFIDTPGIRPRGRRAIDHAMARIAGETLSAVNCALLLIGADGWRADDEPPLQLVRESGLPVVLAINKADKVKPKELLLPLIEESAQRFAFADIVPISALRGTNVDRLVACLERLMPEGEQCYPPEQKSDLDQRFMAGELVREQLFRNLEQELPYASAVEIEKLEPTGAVLHVEAVIWVERPGQKAIVIGKGGERLKAIGAAARREMERQFGMQVFLALWVKVRPDWSDDPQTLRRLGYLRRG